MTVNDPWLPQTAPFEKKLRRLYHLCNEWTVSNFRTGVAFLSQIFNTPLLLLVLRYKISPCSPALATVRIARSSSGVFKIWDLEATPVLKFKILCITLFDFWVSVRNEQITPYFTSRDFSGKQYQKTIHIAIVMNTATNAVFVFFCLVIHSYSTVSLWISQKRIF